MVESSTTRLLPGMTIGAGLPLVSPLALMTVCSALQILPPSVERFITRSMAPRSLQTLAPPLRPSANASSAPSFALTMVGMR
ncbi:hypothetical protein [Amycolatopsis sp. NPDC051061]|uniref:hypothetical protein n=1 Tax=Amycolatopsis sp. NPDC051061 TaxID=3155042 RepID=UPI00341E1D48